MKNIEALKKEICESIDAHRLEIEHIGDQIFTNPELGFKENKTAKLVAKTMKAFGIEHKTGLAHTGVKGLLKGKNPGPTVALIGEMDSVRVSDHPQADPETGAAHSCGHNAQIAGLLGAMMGIVESGVAEHLAGNIVFFAVPAEEYVEVEYRTELVKKSKLQLLSGKQELICRGEFDDIDLALMIHIMSSSDFPKKAANPANSNAFVMKKIRFIGVPAHSGAMQHQGVNALNAANIALAAINAQRETFRDEDSVRVAPIITKGGELANVVPADVQIETYVRANNNDALKAADSKIDRALRAGAMAVGAKVDIETIPGYLPLNNQQELKNLFFKTAEALFGPEEVVEIPRMTGSTDMGDLSQIIPALQPAINGATGQMHGNNFQISDKELAYLAPAKSLAMMAVELLYGDATPARDIVKNFQPMMTKEEYLAYQKGMFRIETYDGETGESKP